MSLSSRNVLKTLRANGFEKDRQRGSHVQMWNPESKRLVTVPHPKKDFPTGTIKSIERQSGVKLR